MLIQQIVSGLLAGSLYALAALGLVLIYKTSDLVNFAQGSMAMISTFICFTGLTLWGFGYWVSFLAALIFSFIMGMIIERVLMRPVQKAPVISQIILTFGLDMVLLGVAGMIWGYNPTSFPEAINGKPVSIGSIVLTPNQMFILVLTFALMVLFYCLFRFTMIGLAMRAAAQNLRTAELMGIRVGSIFSLTWGISAVLGGIAGILIVPSTFLDPTMMQQVVLKAFAAAVIGGFTSLPGAVVGGLLIGLLENLVGGYISAELKTAFVFFLIIAALYIKPTGLFGAKQVKKV